MSWFILIIAFIFAFGILLAFRDEASKGGGSAYGGSNYPVNGGGSYSFEIVGEGSCQGNILSIAGSKEKVSKSLYCQATVMAEPNNLHDSNAVVVNINGKKVGYFSRSDAIRFHKFLSAKGLSSSTSFQVPALIVGGWRDKHSEGDYGVKLDAYKDFNKWV